jgi:hypothetical protein
MNIIEKLTKSEKVFQDWLIASYETHQKPGVEAKDFLNVGSPTDSGEKYAGFDFLFKRTIRTPTAFIGNHDAFAIALLEFIIDNALDLYGDSIRIAVKGKKSLAIYKNCGGEIGGFFCELNREGNIFTLGVIYQIYWGYNSILIAPRQLASCTAAEIRKSYAYVAKRRLKLFYSKRFLIFLIISIILAAIALGLIASGISGLAILGVFFGFLTFGYIRSCWNRWVNNETASERSEIENEAIVRLAHDLSPIHFPVKYFSHEKTAEAIAKNHDHQAFIERLQSILEKAVLAGEQ